MRKEISLESCRTVHRRQTAQSTRKTGRSDFGPRSPALEQFKLKSTRWVMGTTLPHPCPLPLGEGETFPVFWRGNDCVLRGESSEFWPATNGCSLSQRERVRVRENAPIHSTTGHTFFESALEQGNRPPVRNTSMTCAKPGHLLKAFSPAANLPAGSSPMRFVPTTSSSIQSFCA